MNTQKIVETRKVQRFGKSTLMISLPSEWVKIVDLKPSDLVVLEVKDDGSLVVFPQKLAEKRIRGKEIRIILSKNTNEELVQRALYTSYIIGYDRIVIEYENGSIPPHIMSSIRTMVRMLIGAEIVAQTKNSIVIQNFVDTERYSIDGLVERMSSTIKSMLDYLITSIKTGLTEHLKEITELEFEMDRVHALAIRYVYALNIQNTSHFLTEYRVLIKTLEDVGDSLAQAAQILNEKTVLIEVIKEVVGDKLEEMKLHLSYTIDMILQAITNQDLAIASRAADLAAEATKFVSRLEADVIPKYKSLEDYLKMKSFFEKLMLLCFNLQAAAEVAFDIVMSKKENVIKLS
ncbi:phosphate uptake regulator PhoU [Ignisphaera sp. 4213-co]|uniref:Phosphate uptake regulator PhoU n=1 Tax=Ignisphaera cupida TaxID=3050454 RepID=A0ABD4Z8B2_9CREN|nr:phosphate uptake regulator PhoU [Ignisphaera sp. 4213-co]MDK6028343.1 phosphate uptake regulator PhoU [Ignisphaera sp. 4213-co]